MLLLFTLCTFFVLIGSRGLNEPDEGRYAEIAREMIETRDWLVPHFWYLPHFDKPPMTYWLVAMSMEFFGRNEWAVRLPVALAGLSGVWAVLLLGRSIGGRRVGRWSALVLQASLLYFVMARMLTTDVFLTQFVAWAIYFFWRSWLCVRRAESVNGFWKWHLAGWVAVVFAFLTKGPIALAIPLVAWLTLIVSRWKTLERKGTLLGGMFCGVGLFFVLAAPWFLAVNQRIPGTLNYMVFHQAAGHVTGATISNRRGFPFYFFAILAVGLLPWSWLLGWLWRRAHWRQLPELQKDAWLMLNFWAGFTFTLFSVTHSKLPAYILPIFPALAVMLALRFFPEGDEKKTAPGWCWSLCAVSGFLLPVVFTLALPKVFHVALPLWMKIQMPVAVILMLGFFWMARRWEVPLRAGVGVLVSVVSFLLVAAEARSFETSFKANQTLKPFAASLREHHRPNDAIVCWGLLPEGLPFYGEGVIDSANRPFFAGMNLGRVPFEFPHNAERLGALLLTDDELIRLVGERQRVLVVVQQRFVAGLENATSKIEWHEVAESGQWKLMSNQ